MKTFNKDVEEGVAVLAAMADQGIKSELAGNQLDRVIRLMAQSSQTAAAGHKALGFSVFDASGKMRHMSDLVGQLEHIMAGMSDEMKVITLDMLGFQARTQQAILPLIGLSGAITDYETQLKNADSTTKQISDKQLKSFANQTKILWNQIKLVGIEIGERLAPLLLALNRIITTGAKWWGTLSDSTKTFIVHIGLAAASIGPLLIVGGKMLAIGTRLTSMFFKTGKVLIGLAAQYIASKKAALAHTAEMARQNAAQKVTAASTVQTSVVQSRSLALTSTQIASSSGQWIRHAGVVQASNLKITTASNASTLIISRNTTAVIGQLKALQIQYALTASTAQGSYATMAAGVAPMKRIGGASVAMAKGGQVIDATFKKAAVSTSLFSKAAGAGRGMMGKFGGMMGKVGATAGAFKLELAALVGIIAFKLTMALSGANRAYAKFNKEMEKARELTDKSLEQKDRRLDRTFEELSFEKPTKRLAGLKKQLEIYKKRAQGTGRLIKANEAEVARLKSKTGSSIGVGSSLIKLSLIHI